MLNLPFLKKIQDNTSFMTLNLDACEVRCLTFYKSDNGEFKIVGSGMQSVDEGVIRNGNIIDNKVVIQAIEEIVEKANTNTEYDIKDVILGISSDLCLETVTTAKITRKTKDEITKKEFDEYQQKIVDSSYTQIQNQNAENTGDFNNVFELITSSLIYIKVDGKIVDTPVGVTGEKIEIALYTAYCPNHYLSNIKSLFKKLKLNLTAITPQTFAILKAFNKSQIDNKDLVTIQVENDYTNVSTVIEGAIVGNKSLHIGYNNFVEEISEIMGVSSNEAKKILISHGRNELTQSESVLVQESLKNVLDIWLEGLSLLFKSFPNVKTFPNKIYLYGKGSHLSELEEILSEVPWTKPIPFRAPPEFETIKFDQIKNIFDSVGEVATIQWLPTAVLCFIHEEIYG